MAPGNSFRPRKPSLDKQASVDIQENTPIGRSDAALIAANEERMVTDQETLTEENGNVLVTHTRPGTLVMYKPTERQGFVPRTVSGSAIRLLLKQGWKEVCPDCNDRHLNGDGVDSTDPNLCAARDPVAVRICRVCTKRIYDNQGFLNVEAEAAADDPNVIEDEAYKTTTGADRTRASLNLHYWLRHPKEAQMMGLAPLPKALSDIVEGAKA